VRYERGVREPLRLQAASGRLILAQCVWKVIFDLCGRDFCSVSLFVVRALSGRFYGRRDSSTIPAGLAHVITDIYRVTFVLSNASSVNAVEIGMLEARDCPV
jgi:hypothetical protein